MSHKKYVVAHENYLKSLKFDIPAGLVVFLVAIPLCLGIALASGAPLFAGLIAGIIGGLVVPWISQSQLGVSGPAAGLTAVVLAGIAAIGSYQGFLVAVVLAGLVQIILGVSRSGFIAYYIPSSVIKGMLAAIGIILFIKQLPHALGYDHELFSLTLSEENIIVAFQHAFAHLEWGALIITTLSLGILILWQNSFLKNITWLPGALVVVGFGILVNTVIFGYTVPDLKLNFSHLVALPKIDLNALTNSFISLDFTYLREQGILTTPDWSMFFNKDVLQYAIIIGVIASIETLLTIEAVDKLDPYKRKSPLNRELIAQGLGNSVSGLIGGLPLTSVIVRSTANISSGGKTKVAAIVHGVFLLIAVLFLAPILNLVPLASLAAILLMVGYKLARPQIFKEIFSKGWNQFLPFVFTISAILATDLLIGVAFGIVMGLFFVIRTNFHSAFSITENKNGKHVLIRFNQDVSFLNKPLLMDTLERIEEGAYVIIDGARATFVDFDVQEILEEFKQEAILKNIQIEFKNIKATTLTT